MVADHLARAEQIGAGQLLRVELGLLELHQGLVGIGDAVQQCLAGLRGQRFGIERLARFDPDEGEALA
ncbi:hypothetical protein D3C81_2194950 [compost metagenome]